MATLRAMCTRAGFANVRTYIASGNVVLDSDDDAASVRATIEAQLAGYFSRAAAVAIRTASELAAILAGNPFPDAEPKHTYVMFLDNAPPCDALVQAVGRTDEMMQLGAREIYVAYPAGMGRSKLRIPAAAAGTARNLNTVSALVKLASGS
jgi:uncharacterized protein (DUF1697 family)